MICTVCCIYINECEFEDEESYERYEKYGICQTCQNTIENHGMLLVNSNINTQNN
jgi:hypothetical protein